MATCISVSEARGLVNIRMALANPLLYRYHAFMLGPQKNPSTPPLTPPIASLDYRSPPKRNPHTLWWGFFQFLALVTLFIGLLTGAAGIEALINHGRPEFQVADVGCIVVILIFGGVWMVQSPNRSTVFLTFIAGILALTSRILILSHFGG